MQLTICSVHSNVECDRSKTHALMHSHTHFHTHKMDNFKVICLERFTLEYFSQIIVLLLKGDNNNAMNLYQIMRETNDARFILSLLPTY